MRTFKITACVPSQTRIRTQRELQNTYFTKLVPYDNWFREQQRIMKMGGKIIKVELATGKQGTNAGLSQRAKKKDLKKRSQLRSLFVINDKVSNPKLTS